MSLWSSTTRIKPTAPAVGGVKATSKRRRACGATLTPPAAADAQRASRLRKYRSHRSPEV